MKRLINISTLLVALLGLTTACNYLDKEPLHAVSDETFWKNQNEARAFLDNIYNSITPWDHLYTESATDNAYLRYPWEGSDLRDYTAGVHTSFTGFCGWWFSYTDIRNCYEFLNRVDDVPGIDATENTEMRAEVHFFLASEYFDMWKVYKEVPLVDKLLTLEEADVPTATEEEIKAFIVENIDIAIAGLPETRSDGRLTKAAAEMLKADYLLWIADYAGVATLTGDIIKSGNYALEANYDDLFHSSTQTGTKENILWREYKNGVTEDWANYLNYAFLPNGFGGGWSSISPSTLLADAYEAKDGSYPYTTSPLYDPVNDPKGYTIRDSRFEETILYDGVYYESILYNPLDLTEGNPNKIGGSNCTLTGYNFRKYTDMDKVTHSLCDVNNYVYRYAETLLMFAEAQNEITGPTTEIYNAINQIRTRAGMPNVNQSIYNSKDALRELIQRERRVEFAGESKRFWDTWRWGQNKYGSPAHWSENTLTNDMESVDYEHADGDSYTDFLRKRRDGGMGDRTYVFPIPQTALDVSKNITQHPAWR
ncbi:RagB/SusD family nutrient uptake outer membrane protein [Flammeovirga pectinis]|uniref:RagB/SusD family nutrient uptake outer membrane protein n=1 Tax=Flammeovirga pectinis TaxID=2494373 RepID=A0A3Q9FRY0_9BACT|nr:RagB/SusD family nutrient uptake outer membrane protein [Flammeovirga pectinis]AZQ65004.1 RagB/SusD family nutrient uptake outer membrane protein [Flammeovirga pectinis]